MFQRFFLFQLSLFISSHLFSQDSALVKSIDEMTRKKYDLQNKTYSILTKEKIVPEASESGTEISISLVNDSIYRIVCVGYNEKGQWAKEYYPLNGELVFTYFTNSFFADDKLETDFKNWKGYPTSEGRAYYRSGVLLQEKHDGFKNQQPFLRMLSELSSQYRAILKWVKEKLPTVILK